MFSSISTKTSTRSSFTRRSVSRFYEIWHAESNVIYAWRLTHSCFCGSAWRPITTQKWKSVSGCRNITLISWRRASCYRC